MSIYGYKPKTKPAMWRSVHASASAPVPSRKPRKRIRAVSKRLASEKRLYREEAAVFVAAAVARGERCPVVALVPELRGGMKYGHPVSDKLNEIHHRRGRLGTLLRDQRFWVALSKQGHRYVHEHPQWAREHGFMVPKGLWNVPHRPGLCLGCGYRIDPSCEWCGECLCETEGND